MIQKTNNDLSDRYSRNEIKNIKLLQQLIERSNINKGDIVYDIGAGSGSISKALLDKGARVIGIEKNPDIFARCRRKFLCEPLELHCDDFLCMSFPLHPEGVPYKVFANIPFNYTAEIVNKLLNTRNSPAVCCLVIQKEAAEKYCGAKEETLQSLLLKPKFWMEVTHYFERSDFLPIPGIDIVLTHFEKRSSSLVAEEQYQLYRDFIYFCREVPSCTVKRSFMRLFTWNQFKYLTRVLDIQHHDSPAKLSFRQYLNAFHYYVERLKKDNAYSVVGAELDFIRKHGTREKYVRKW